MVSMVHESNTRSNQLQREKHDPAIEFLYWPGCPSHPEALARLQEVMAETGLELSVTQIKVLTEEDAERLAFPGSPTIRVNGVDVDPSGAEQMGMALTCRIYRLEDGRISPLPSKGMIRRSLDQASAG
jgi:hypothetical protein